jgi:hypothetical protein
MSLIRTVVVAFALFAWLVPIALGIAPVDSGRLALIFLSASPMLLALLCAIPTTADCLSREKREGTLPLLLLTPLHPIEIVIQKIISASIAFVSALLAMLPLYALPVLLGGVTGNDVLAISILSLSVTSISLSTGLLTSSLCYSTATAIASASIVLMALWTTPFFTTVIRPSTHRTICDVHPLWLYVKLSLDPKFSISAIHAIIVLACSSALSMLFIYLASILIRTTQLTVVLSRRLPIGREPLVRSILIRTFTQLKKEVPKLILCSRAVLPRDFGVKGFDSGITVIASLSLFAWSLFVGNPTVLLALGLIVTNLTKLTFLLAFMRVFANRPWVETLLTTPLDPLAFIALEARSRAPSLTALIGICLSTCVALTLRLTPPLREIAIDLACFAVLDSVTLAVVGLWNGLRCRSPSRALGLSISTVLLLPGGIAISFISFGFRTATLAGGLVLWGVLASVIDILATANSAWMLRHRLRLAANQL